MQGPLGKNRCALRRGSVPPTCVPLSWPSTSYTVLPSVVEIPPKRYQIARSPPWNFPRSLLWCNVCASPIARRQRVLVRITLLARYGLGERDEGGSKHGRKSRVKRDAGEYENIRIKMSGGSWDGYQFDFRRSSASLLLPIPEPSRADAIPCFPHGASRYCDPAQAHTARAIFAAECAPGLIVVLRPQTGAPA
jgi:hypothetical protein